MSTKSTALDVRHQNQMSNSPHVTTTISTPKTNHVSTVLLYDIPIVSLYIEGQERLCLAQISNTLLKQFSYNEIHNRRVALGITCVQCTPVQLEILRRAGAMPVSSRRCGMITRREAERLCKSFLGDNAPPRLPDDFAFSVHHKCAWGCHGSFLPARYNSSRAKCIKCSYCGLFFSPNKFIFHSHRISANDKYVQPDAANFNSWRRHMTLSGHLPDEIVYAWEDVKAMFNGGTRKRLMSSHSPVVNRATVTQQHNKLNDSVSSDSIVLGVIEERNSETYQSPKRVRESSSIGAVTASAVVGVTAMATTVSAVSQQLPVRPFNIHSATTVMPANGLSCEATSGVPTTNEISIMPFSHSFMMDYMWHAHAVQSATHLQQHQKCNGSNAEAFCFPNSSLPWIKNSNGVGGNGSLLFEASCAGAQLPTHIDVDHVSKQATSYDAKSSSASAIVSSASQIAGIKIFREPTTALPQFLKSSAFKPVIQHHQQLQPDRPSTVANTTASSMLKAASATATTATLVSTSVYTSAAVAAAAVAAKLSSSLSTSSSSSPNSSSSSLSNAAVVQAASMPASPTFGNRTKFFNAPNSLMHLLPPPTSPLLTIPRETLKTKAFSLAATTTKVPMNNVMEKRCLRSPTSEEISKFRASISFPVTRYLKESHSSEEDEAEAEDDELVDIETTEDDQLVLENYHHHEDQRSPTPRQKIFLSTGQLCQRKYERCISMDEIIVDGDDDSDTCNADAPSVSAEMPHVVNVTVNQACEESVQFCRQQAKRNSIDHHVNDIEHIKTDRPCSIEIVENSNESACDILSKSEEGETVLKSETLCKLDTTSLTTLADVSVNIERDKNERAEGAKVTCYSPNLKILKLPKSKQQQQQEKKCITVGSLEATSPPATTTSITASITTKTGTISNTTTDAVFVEALTCCSNSDNNIINNNKNTNTNNNNNEFWQAARLSLQDHPSDSFDQQQQFRSHYQQQHQAIYNIPFQMHRQQQQQKQPLQHKQDLQLQQHQYAAAAAHELLTAKHFRVANNFRYLGHESQPRQANGVG